MMDRPESVFLKRIWNGQIERRRFLGLTEAVARVVAMTA